MHPRVYNSSIAHLYGDSLEASLQDLMTPSLVLNKQHKHLLGVLNLGVAHEHLRNIQGAIQSYEVYSRHFRMMALLYFV